MKQRILPCFVAVALLAGCETKQSDTKDQLAEAGQDTAVMARDGQTAGDAAATAGGAAGNAWDMTQSQVGGCQIQGNHAARRASAGRRGLQCIQRRRNRAV